jgi:hypothetical protein
VGITCAQLQETPGRGKVLAQPARYISGSESQTILRWPAAAVVILEEDSSRPRYGNRCYDMCAEPKLTIEGPFVVLALGRGRQDQLGV